MSELFSYKLRLDRSIVSKIVLLSDLANITGKKTIVGKRNILHSLREPLTLLYVDSPGDQLATFLKSCKNQVKCKVHVNYIQDVTIKHLAFSLFFFIQSLRKKTLS